MEAWVAVICRSLTAALDLFGTPARGRGAVFVEDPSAALSLPRLPDADHDFAGAADTN